MSFLFLLFAFLCWGSVSEETTSYLILSYHWRISPLRRCILCIDMWGCTTDIPVLRHVLTSCIFTYSSWYHQINIPLLLPLLPLFLAHWTLFYKNNFIRTSSLKMSSYHIMNNLRKNSASKRGSDMLIQGGPIKNKQI